VAGKTGTSATSLASSLASKERRIVAHDAGGLPLRKTHSNSHETLFLYLPTLKRLRRIHCFVQGKGSEHSLDNVCLIESTGMNSFGLPWLLSAHLLSVAICSDVAMGDPTPFQYAGGAEPFLVQGLELRAQTTSNVSWTSRSTFSTIAITNSTTTNPIKPPPPAPIALSEASYAASIPRPSSVSAIPTPSSQSAVVGWSAAPVHMSDTLPTVTRASTNEGAAESTALQLSTAGSSDAVSDLSLPAITTGRVPASGLNSDGADSSSFFDTKSSTTPPGYAVTSSSPRASAGTLDSGAALSTKAGWTTLVVVVAWISVSLW
jgi:hypothetical protein